MGLSSSSPVEFSIHAQHSALSVGWLIVVLLCDSALSLHEISIYQCGRRSCQTQIKISHKMNKMMKPMPMAVIGKWTASADNFPIPQSPHTSTLTQTTINILVIAVVSAPPIQFYPTALPTLVRFLSLTHTHSLRKQKKIKNIAFRLSPRPSNENTHIFSSTPCHVFHFNVNAISISIRKDIQTICESAPSRCVFFIFFLAVTRVQMVWPWPPLLFGYSARQRQFDS